MTDSISDLNIPYLNDTGWCPVCRATTGFYAGFSFKQIWPEELVIGGAGSGQITQDGVKTIRTLRCQICSNTVTLLETRDSDENSSRGKLLDSRVIYPPIHLSRLDDSVPENIRSLYEEGELCESVGAYRAAAGLYRACVEQICKDKQAGDGVLYHRIEGLRKNLKAEEYIVDDMHEARILGNDSLHDGLAYEQDEVRDVADLIHEALLVLYIQPEERRLMKEKRKQRRRR